MSKLRFILLLILMLLLTALPVQAESDFISDEARINEAASSVIRIIADKSIGTGFAAFDNQTIIADYDLIAGAESIRAYVPDSSGQLWYINVDRVLASDPVLGISICSIDWEDSGLAPLPLKAESALQMGERIVALNTLNYKKEYGQITGMYIENDALWIQHDAPLAFGSVLFDDHGNVIGITESDTSFSTDPSDAETEKGDEVSFAIHSSAIIELYESIGAEEPAASAAPEADAATSATPTQAPVASSGSSYVDDLLARFGISPSSTPLPTYEPLSKGAHGDAVKRLQEALISLGYLADSADGSFGSKTETAVLRFNEQNGISSGGTASSITQQRLYHGSPACYVEPDIVLSFFDGASVNYEFVSDGMMQARVQVMNTGMHKTVKAFELYVYAKDIWGENLYGDDIYYGTTEKKIAPGSAAYSDYFCIPCGEDIHELYIGIHRVAYTDGTAYTIDDVDYWWWTFD